MQHEQSSFNNKTRIINHKLNHAKKKKSKDDRIFAKKYAPAFSFLLTLLKRTEKNSSVQVGKVQ